MEEEEKEGLNSKSQQQKLIIAFISAFDKLRRSIVEVDCNKHKRNKDIHRDIEC